MCSRLRRHDVHMCHVHKDGECKGKAELALAIFRTRDTMVRGWSDCTAARAFALQPQAESYMLPRGLLGMTRAQTQE